MSGAHPPRSDEETFRRLVLPGVYNVKLVGVRNAVGRPNEVTKRFVFRITKGQFKNIPLCYFATINGKDQNFHLKFILHFLRYSFNSVEDINLKDVRERYCKLKVRHREKNGRVYPEIYGFMYSEE